MKRSNPSHRLWPQLLISSVILIGVTTSSPEAKASTQPSEGGTGSMNEVFGSGTGSGNLSGLLNEISGGNLSDLLGNSSGLGSIFEGVKGIGGIFGGSGGAGGSDISSALTQITQGVGQIRQLVGSNLGESLQQYIGPIQQFLTQIDQLRQGGLGSLLSRLGMGGEARPTDPQLKAVIQQSLGELNLPDPNVIAQNIERLAGTQNSSTPVLGGINATVRESLAQANTNIYAARMVAAQVLSKEAQEAAKQQLEKIQQTASDSMTQSQANTALAGQSQQAAALAVASNAQSASTAQQGVQLGADAQNQVSTQDVLKTQAQLSAAQSLQLQSLSDQMAASSSQETAQSAQLGNISGQLAGSTEIQAYQSLQQQQINNSLATMNQTISDLSEQQQGARQAQVVNEASAARSNNSAWSRVGLMK